MQTNRTAGQLLVSGLDKYLNKTIRNKKEIGAIISIVEAIYMDRPDKNAELWLSAVNSMHVNVTSIEVSGTLGEVAAKVDDCIVIAAYSRGRKLIQAIKETVNDSDTFRIEEAESNKPPKPLGPPCNIWISNMQLLNTDVDKLVDMVTGKRPVENVGIKRYNDSGYFCRGFATNSTPFQGEESFINVWIDLSDVPIERPNGLAVRDLLIALEYLRREFETIHDSRREPGFAERGRRSRVTKDDLITPITLITASENKVVFAAARLLTEILDKVTEFVVHKDYDVISLEKIVPPPGLEFTHNNLFKMVVSV